MERSEGTVGIRPSSGAIAESRGRAPSHGPGARLLGVALVLLGGLVCAREAASEASCARCLAPGTPPEACTAACAPEIRAVLAGKRLVTRRSDDLENDCIALDVVHPMLRPEGRRLLSKPLDEAEVAHALRYGRRRVRVLPACADRDLELPEHVTLGRPLSSADRLRDDGTPKPTVFVDRSHPRCLRAGSAEQLASPATPACDLASALRATRATGGAIVEIAEGVYPEPRGLALAHGHVVVARDDEPVTLTGWIDVGDPARAWAKAWEDETGSVWAMDWSDHRETGGAAGLKLPLTLDGAEVPVAPHFAPDSRAPDVREIDFRTHVVDVPGDAIHVWADPGHVAACMDSGVNVKSRARTCERDGRRVPCDACSRAGLPIRTAQKLGAACRPQPGTCAPVYNWRTVKEAALEACRRVLGPRTRKCLLLKLPRGDAPTSHAIRASHTDHGFHLFNDEERGATASGVVLKGLRLENVPVRVWGAAEARARSGWVARLDGLELVASQVELLGSRTSLENSWGRSGHLYVSSPRGPLRDVVVRNNVLVRYRGKPISWGDGRASGGTPSPARLHALRPLCERGPCAGPDAPTLFSGREGLVGWRGWNRILFNWIQEGAAINASRPVSHLVVAGNVFDHGGVQEGIIELPFGAEHVWIHHNWARDGIGTGIRILGRSLDLVVSDNQLHRSPGDPALGAGSEWSRARCGGDADRCWGAHRSILLRPDAKPCREVTIENNLSAGSRHGGFAIQACDGLTLRNNTATRARRLPEIVLLSSPVPRAPARLLGNVASDAARPTDAGASHGPFGPHPFTAAESRGNFLQGCAPGGEGCPEANGTPVATTDPAWSRPPRYARPDDDDFRLLGGWAGGDACLEHPEARYPHPGFCYREERCVPR